MSTIDNDPCNNIALLQTNSQLANACACKKASNALEAAMNTYTAQYEKYNADIVAYNAARAAHDRWQNMSGEYASWNDKRAQLIDEKKPWNNCVAWNDTQSGAHNDWCRNDAGQGWYHAGQTGSGCSAGFGKGVCQRTTDQVIVDLRNAGYNAGEPAVPGQPIPPIPPNGNNIQCCSQMFSNITADNINFSDIQQNCSQTIQQQIQSAISATTAQTTLPPQKLQATQAPETTTTFQNNIPLIGIIVLIIILCLFLSGMGIVLM